MNAILEDEVDRPIRGRRWRKAKETERRWKSAQVVNSHTRSERSTNKQMGVANSIAANETKPGNQITNSSEKILPNKPS